MDKAPEIANSITNANSTEWQYYLLLLALVVVGTYIGAFLREYAKKRGNQFATKADLEEIQKQLKSSTSITESIKSDIAHGAWRSRELEILKREKLEQYLLNYYEAVEALSKRMNCDFFYEKSSWNETAESTASMLQKLYLPELGNEHAAYLRAHAAFLTWLADGKRELLNKKRAGEQMPVISQDHMDLYTGLLAQLNSATLTIEAKAKSVASNLNNA